MGRAIGLATLAAILWVIFGDPQFYGLLGSIPGGSVVFPISFALWWSPVLRLLVGTGIIFGLVFLIARPSARSKGQDEGETPKAQ